MVMFTRSMAAKRAPLFGLPHDVIVEIAGHVAACSRRPMDDLSSIRATCKAMHAACKDPAVARRVSLENEIAMKWDDTARYNALVARLAASGNPEACFVTGMALIFAHRNAQQGAAALDRAAAAGHKAAAYVLGLLLYRVDGAREAAKQYIAQVEGDFVDGTGAGGAKWSNRECRRCRSEALFALRDATWKMTGLRVWAALRRAWGLVRGRSAQVALYVAAKWAAGKAVSPLSRLAMVWLPHSVVTGSLIPMEAALVYTMRCAVDVVSVAVVAAYYFQCTKSDGGERMNKQE